jgi:hypothetical protein
VAQVVTTPEPHAPPVPPRPPSVADPRPRTSDLARGPFYVSTLDWTAQTYSIARYSRGRPLPSGSVAAVHRDASKSCPGLNEPSITRDAGGTYFLYSSERVCGARHPRVALWTSADGRRFTRRGEILTGTGAWTAYVVYDRGVFRAWYAEQGPERGLYYAESRDGLHFRRVGGRKGARPYAVRVVRAGRRWYVFYGRRTRGRRPRTRAALLEFSDPHQATYTDAGPMTHDRPVGDTLSAVAGKGSRALRVAVPGRIRVGATVVVAGRAGTGDAVQVRRVDGRWLHLDRPLRVRHAPGDHLALAESLGAVPSYVCRGRGGTWEGIFTTLQPLHETLFQLTLAYRARSIDGPWRVDRSAKAPVLAHENQQYRRVVVSPAPVTRRPDVAACGRRAAG